jgi:acid phosphatase
MRFFKSVVILLLLAALGGLVSFYTGGTVSQADAWLKEHLDDYAKWAETHRSLLIVTWDEDDNTSDNRIPTLFAGPVIKAGRYDNPIDHYNVLRTLEDLLGIPPIGKSREAEPISYIWKAGTP